jgi:hypothetical protein
MTTIATTMAPIVDDPAMLVVACRATPAAIAVDAGAAWRDHARRSDGRPPLGQPALRRNPGQVSIGSAARTTCIPAAA